MPTNFEIATILLEVAEALAMRGADQYRIRAYRQAARTILSLHEPLEEIHRRGALQSLQGIGESLSRKIEEILTTGHLRQHDILMEETPPGMMAMMRIPGIGPRTAATLYHQLGIAGINELEHAAQEGRLRLLKGFGAKTEANILQNIERRGNTWKALD